jgi:hypothetical protein
MKQLLGKLLILNTKDFHMDLAISSSVGLTHPIKIFQDGFLQDKQFSYLQLLKK